MGKCLYTRNGEVNGLQLHLRNIPNIHDLFIFHEIYFLYFFNRKLFMNLRDSLLVLEYIPESFFPDHQTDSASNELPEMDVFYSSEEFESLNFDSGDLELVATQVQNLTISIPDLPGLPDLDTEGHEDTGSIPQTVLDLATPQIARIRCKSWRIIAKQKKRV